jgi:hypothetical protein
MALLVAARIERTTDGGYTWNPVFVDSSEVSDYPVIRFKFYDEMLGYASGGQRDQAGVMWRTIGWWIELVRLWYQPG